jgi:ABC-type phosphate transport system substrate-binding protein
MRVLTSRTAKLATLTGLVALVLATLVAPAIAAVTITGAGATFPAPLYYKWANDWKAKTGNKVNYQAIGSGGGISAIKAGTVLFGGSDAPLTAGELSSAGLVQFPTCIGGVVRSSICPASVTASSSSPAPSSRRSTSARSRCGTPAPSRRSTPA